MDKFTKYTNFLESLRTEENSDSIEVVKEAFSAIYESYADVIETDRGDATTQFNNKAADLARSMGNNVQNFLKQSGERNQLKYTFDDDPSDTQEAYSSTVDLVLGGEESGDMFGEFIKDMAVKDEYESQNDSLGFNLPLEINDSI